MKKTLLLAISLTCFTAISQSQDYTLGFQGGLSSSNISADQMFENADNRLGFTGGLKFELLLSNKYSLGADLLYSQQGFVEELTFSDEAGNLETKFYYDYCALPIKFGYALGANSEGNLKVIPKIGLQPALLVNAKTTSPKIDELGNYIGSETIDVQDEVSPFDLAGLLEVEISYAINQNIDVFTSLMGKYSFTTFSNSDYFREGDLRHKSLAVSLGLKYKLAKN